MQASARTVTKASLPSDLTGRIDQLRGIKMALAMDASVASRSSPGGMPAGLSSRLTIHQLGRLATVATIGIGIGFAVAQVLGLTPFAFDAGAYWAATPGDLYPTGWAGKGQYGAFMYSPAFADALAPSRLLPERAFTGLWQFGLFVVLAVFLRGWSFPLVFAGLISLAVPMPVAGLVLGEIAHGNIHILFGAIAILGLRYPALWAFVLLSKVTPGIGLLWFLVRKEWRNLAIALGVTAIIALASFVYAPGDWFDWASLLVTSADYKFAQWVVPISLPVRLAMSAILVVWGARTDRPWVLPIAVGWSIPMPYPSLLVTMAFVLNYVRRPKAGQPTAG